jgi:hypothetical protein
VEAALWSLLINSSKYIWVSFCREHLSDLLNCVSLTRAGLCSMNDASGFGSVNFMYYSFRFQFSPYAAAPSCLNFCCLENTRRRLVSLFERYYLLMLTVLSCDWMWILLQYGPAWNIYVLVVAFLLRHDNSIITYFYFLFSCYACQKN